MRTSFKVKRFGSELGISVSSNLPQLCAELYFCNVISAFLRDTHEVLSGGRRKRGRWCRFCLCLCWRCCPSKCAKFSFMARLAIQV